MDLAKICGVDKDLLDQKIADLLNTDIDLPHTLKEPLLNLIFSSGKRLRPIFTVLGSYYGIKDCEDIYSLAAVFELIHTASLIHDDIIDKADTRRGNETLHIKNGIFNTLILGNYIVALCSEYVSNYDFEEIYYENFHLTSLCESEINQQMLLFDFSITFDEYINKTKNKTALLIAASLVGGAKAAHADEDTLKMLYDYSINLGISFQIIDDILDFTQNKEHLGKPNGADLMNGNITLPVILALRNKKIRKKMLQLNKNSTLEEYKSCINDIIQSNTINKSKNINRYYLSKAKKAIRRLKHPKKTILINILNELEKRTY